MKKALYIILLAVEFLLGAIILSFVCAFTGWTFLALFFAVWAILFVLLLIKLKKAECDKCRRKIKFLLALDMLIPLVVGIVAFIVTASMYF